MKVTYEETMELLKAPWKKGFLTRDFRYEGTHPAGEMVLWKVYHNDPSYISIRLLDSKGHPLVEFTEVPELVTGEKI
jgi:hypothetical protein